MPCRAEFRPFCVHWPKAACGPFGRSRWWVSVGDPAKSAVFAGQGGRWRLLMTPGRTQGQYFDPCISNEHCVLPLRRQ
ncbi:MAG: hypothetical protein QOI59_4306 [Gammaproteobacteria bacterium]|jgi:hypothetical protein|nr:hypothetical protein [Gammaproteobacteria bacterium]